MNPFGCRALSDNDVMCVFRSGPKSFQLGVEPAGSEHVQRSLSGQSVSL